jgi:hypothetical protein
MTHPMKTDNPKRMTVQECKDAIAGRPEYIDGDNPPFKNWMEFQDYCLKVWQPSVLSEAIDKAFALYASQFTTPPQSGETVFRKVSVKERLPEPSVSFVTFFPRRNGKLISGKFNGTEFFTMGDSWYPSEVEYWLEEIELK